jgi:hypothetical protein
LQTRPDPCYGRYIQRVVSALPGQHIAGQRQAQGIQGRQHDLELRQVRAVVFAVTKLEQTLCRHTPVATAARAVQAHAFRAQVVDPHQLPDQGRLEGRPALIVTQDPQHHCQAVIGEIQALHRLTGAAAQCPQPLFDPGAHMVQPMIAARENVRQPDRHHVSQAQTLPVAVRRKLLVQQGGEPHALHLCLEHGDVVHSLTVRCQHLSHTESLTHCANLVYI